MSTAPRVQPASLGASAPVSSQLSAHTCPGLGPQGTIFACEFERRVPLSFFDPLPLLIEYLPLFYLGGNSQRLSVTES